MTRPSENAGEASDDGTEGWLSRTCNPSLNSGARRSAASTSEGPMGLGCRYAGRGVGTTASEGMPC